MFSAAIWLDTLLSSHFPSRVCNGEGVTVFGSPPSHEVGRGDDYKSSRPHAALQRQQAGGSGVASFLGHRLRRVRTKPRTPPWRNTCSGGWYCRGQQCHDKTCGPAGEQRDSVRQPGGYHIADFGDAFPRLLRLLSQSLGAHNEVAAVRHGPPTTTPDVTAAASSRSACASCLLNPAMKQQLHLYHGLMWCWVSKAEQLAAKAIGGADRPNPCARKGSRSAWRPCGGHTGNQDAWRCG